MRAVIGAAMGPAMGASETIEAMPLAPAALEDNALEDNAIPALEAAPGPASPVRMIAIDLDGTLLNGEARISSANRAALRDALAAGLDVVIATGRRHSYALKVLRDLDLPATVNLVSSNGAVVRTLASELIETTSLDRDAARWLCGHLGDLRNALVITFDRVGPDGDDTRGALVVEDLADLNGSISRWIDANLDYIAQVRPIEDSLRNDAPIQMMLCGSCPRMRGAEALMLSDLRVALVGEHSAGTKLSLNRTEYPERDLSIVDILPAGCSKGAALLRLAAARGLQAAQMMTIGDNWNDISMLEIAGRPVLMANAPDELLRMAATRGWTLTATNEQDGVAEAIQHALRGLRAP